MTKQDIRNIYTQKVTELLSKGYTIFPDTMSGHQGEIAHIDLSNGDEIIRVLLECKQDISLEEDGYTGDIIRLVVGRAGEDTRLSDCWAGLIWNQRLEIIEELKWAYIESKRYHDWYVSIEEGKRIKKVQRERRKIKSGNDKFSHISLDHLELEGDKYKEIAKKWLKKNGVKRISGDIRITHVRSEYGNRFEISAGAKSFTFNCKY